MQLPAHPLPPARLAHGSILSVSFGRFRHTLWCAPVHRPAGTHDWAAHTLAHTEAALRGRAHASIQFQHGSPSTVLWMLQLIHRHILPQSPAGQLNKRQHRSTQVHESQRRMQRSKIPPHTKT